MGDFEKKLEPAGNVGEAVDYLYNTSFNNIAVYADYLKIWAIMISSYSVYLSTDKKPHCNLTAKEFVDFCQEVNNLIEQTLFKEAIIFKKIALIKNIEFMLENKKKFGDDYTLHTVLFDYYKSISQLLDSLMIFTEVKYNLKTRKDLEQRNKINYLILKILDNLSELHQIAYKRIEYLAYRWDFKFDEDLNDLLLNNIDKNIIFVKQITTNKYLDNKNMTINLHKKIISLIRMKKEIKKSLITNSDIQNLSDPWLSKSIFKKNKHQNNN